MSRVIRQPSLPQRQRRDTQVLLVILVGLVMGLTACAVAQTQIATPTTTVPMSLTTKPPPPEDWQYRWLKKIPCSAPCFEGITPGKTTASEAIEILQGISWITNIRRDSSRPFGRQVDTLYWDWTTGGTGGWAEYQIDDIVYAIVPLNGTPLNIRDVIAAYGEPTHIIAVAQQRTPDRTDLCQDVRLVYLQYGIELVDNCYPRVNVDENMRFVGIVFFVPTKEGLQDINWQAKNHPDWMIPWQGFKGFDYYCRDELGGKLCRGEVQ